MNFMDRFEGAFEFLRYGILPLLLVLMLFFVVVPAAAVWALVGLKAIMPLLMPPGFF